jgi:hypothetical protein
MKKLLLLFAILISITVQAQTYSGGAGTVGNEYLIANLTDLRYLSEHSSDWDKHFKQTANIDASATSGWNSGEGFSPIGNPSVNFTGSYNGQGHIISGLFINRPTTSYVGLFGYTSSTTISDIGLVNCTITGNSVVGALVGIKAGTLSNCYSTGSVFGSFYVGGLVGNVSDAVINNCYTTVSTTGTNAINVGGFAGNMEFGSTITNCYATGSVAGGANVGGLIGSRSFGIISNCYATGSVAGFSSVGGLIGDNSFGTLTNCYATGSVAGSANVGGLIGSSFSASITNCFWDTETSGTTTSAGGTGKTTAEMQTQSTFTGWDFTNVWKMDLGCPNDGYPIFTNQTTTAPPATPSAGSDFSACAGATINLTASNVTGATYSWSGPNAFTSNTQNPSINNATTSMAGNYIVKATVAGCSSLPDTVVVSVNAAPAAPDAGSDFTICAGATINLTASTVAGATYNWTGPNSFTSTTQNPSISNATAAMSGNYIVTATAGGCNSLPDTVMVTVNQPAVNSVANQTICNGDTTMAVNFTGGTPGTVYTWTNNKPSIGLAESGTGNIPSFTTTNTADTVVVATVKVTPTITTGSVVVTSIAMPAQTSTFTGNVRGYWFTAPKSFTITSLQVPTTASTGNQNIAVLKFNGNTPPPVFSGTTNAFTTLFLTQNDTTTGNIAVNITINEGEVIGILGSRNVTGVSSYSLGPTGIVIDGTPVVISRMGMQFNLSNTAPQEVWQELGNSNISRVLFEYTPSITCTGTPTTYTYTVNPTPTAVATPAADTICSGANITTKVLSGAVTGTTFSWTRDNTTSVTGIAASGTGNISGILNNTTAAPVTVTFTITPTANGCTGAPITATVTVNPAPNAIATPATQTICSGANITTIALSSSVAGTTYNWTRDNATVTGIAASGSGDISGTLTNTTAAPVTVTFTITPVVVGGCTVAATTATVAVNPTATVNNVANQVVCNTGTTTAVNFGTTATGGTTTYAWTNNTTSIGLAASGTGNIPSFTATNNGTAPVTATITVTPTYTTPVNNALMFNGNNHIAVTSAPTIPAGNSAYTIEAWVKPNSILGADGIVGWGNYGSTNEVNAFRFNGPTQLINYWWGSDLVVNIPNVLDGNWHHVVATFNGTTRSIYMDGVLRGSDAPTGHNVTITNNLTIAKTCPTCGVELLNGAMDEVRIWNVGRTQAQILATMNATIPVNTPGLAAYYRMDEETGTTTTDNTGNGNNGTLISNPTWIVPSTSPATNLTACVGTPITYTYTVNPTATINAVANQVVCNAGATTAVNFGTTATAGTTTYAWTNNTTSIGLAASGTGNIPSFTATNNGTAPVTATITVTPTYITPVNNALMFNGNNHIAVTSAPTIPAGNSAYTIEAWVKPNSILGADGIVGWGNYGSTNEVNAFRFNGPTQLINYWWGSDLVVNIPNVLDGNWHHVVATFNGTTRSIYMDGVLRGSDTPTGHNVTITNNLTIAKTCPFCGVELLNGAMDEVRIWNVGRTQAQILATMNSTIPVNTAGLAAYYRMDEGTGTITTDNTGNGNNGTLISNPTWIVPSTSPAANLTACTGTPITYTYTVNPTATINAVANQVVCNGASTTVVNFGTTAIPMPIGSTTTYAWTNNTPSIGLAANGTGNLASFNAVNTTTAPITATITVTPTFTNGAVSCVGNVRTFTITVNPTAIVNTVANQVVCNGSPVTAITFGTTAIPMPIGSTTTYAWTNNTTSIGLAASGTGNIASFNGVNTGTAPVTATITVTPTFTNGGVSCVGSPRTFTITVNPTATVTTISNKVECNGSVVAAVTPASPNTGGTVTYAWANNNIAIGLAASGTGIIPSFTATNTGIAPITATVTVTPTFTNGGVSCTGTASTYTITINPTATVNVIANQTICNGSTTTVVNFGTTVIPIPIGSTVVYNWTNNTPSIGLAATGTGNIAAFNAVNTTATPVTATITVTPTFTNGGVSCVGTPRTYTYTVNPSPAVSLAAFAAICKNAAPLTLTGGSPVATTGTTGIYLVNAVAQTVFNPANYAVGLHTIEYVYTNIYGCVNRATQTILVNPIHTVEITASPSTGGLPGAPVVVFATVSPVGNYSYAWSKDNALIPAPNASNITVQPNDAGNYKVAVTSATTGCVVVSGTAFTASAVVPQKLFVFPNPSTGVFNVAYNNGTTASTARTLQVFNSNGAKVFSQSYSVNVPFGNMKVDITNAARGLYFVVLTDSNGKVLATAKVDKQ